MGFIRDLVGSLVSPAFYRNCATKKIGTAIVYALILVVLYSLAVTIVMNVFGISKIVDFCKWGEEKFPPITIQGYTVTAKVQEPYFITYEPLKLDMVFSTSQPYDGMDQAAPNTLVFEKERLLYKGADNAAEEYAYKNVQNMPANANFTIDNTLWSKIRTIISRWAAIVIFVAVFGMAFVGYLLIALVLGVLAFVVSFIVRSSLGFAHAFKVSVYAMTFVSVVTTLSFVVPFLSFPYSNVVYLLVTVGYMIVGVLANKGQKVK